MNWKKISQNQEYLSVTRRFTVKSTRRSETMWKVDIWTRVPAYLSYVRGTVINILKKWSTDIDNEYLTQTSCLWKFTKELKENNNYVKIYEVYKGVWHLLPAHLTKIYVQVLFNTHLWSILWKWKLAFKIS